VTVYENPDALPRAYVVSEARPAKDSDDAIGVINAGGFNLRNAVVLETTPLPPTGPGGGTVAWKMRGTDRLELAVEARGDSIVVVSDTDYPGWEAKVDGKAAPILRANGAFRAVAVPAGSHTVTMAFRPASARYGVLLSALSIAAILAFCGMKTSHGPARSGV